uniref:Uncharacterized protein n=1 Tax=Anguilla anguilla TaxID=7936 RepID=A0A0E9X9U6_ANGAN
MFRKSSSSPLAVRKVGPESGLRSVPLSLRGGGGVQSCRCYLLLIENLLTTSLCMQ